MPSATSNPTAVLGRDLVHNLFVAIRSAQLYEPTNATLQTAAGRLAETIGELHQMDGLARVEVGRDIILVNDTRVRGELRSYTVHAALQHFFAGFESGGFEWLEAPTPDEAARFAGVVGRLEGAGTMTADLLAQRLQDSGIEGVAVLPPRLEKAHDPFEDQDARARAEGTYRRGVAVTRDLMESVRAGRALQRSRVRRTVQTIIDSVLEEPTLLIGLTNLRDTDEPTFAHSVNVCIFAVSLGERIGLPRLDLCELGMVALLHDIGKVDVPDEVLNKVGALSPEEWTMMRRHTSYGAWRVLADRLPGSMSIPATRERMTREMLVAFEHHLQLDLLGYPALRWPRRLSFYSKIVSIADTYDAGTTERVYKTEPLTPSQMVEILHRGSGTRWDPVLVKGFISMLGVFPAGCVCRLDTGEIALVMAANPEDVHRPRVKLLFDPSGNPMEGPIVSLSETDPGGQYMRTVIKVVEAERYGIDVARHFLASELADAT